MSFRWDWDLAGRALGPLMEGLLETALATGGGMALALVLGLGFALARRSSRRALSLLAGAIVEFVRSTPLLVQLFFVFYLLPDYGWNTPLVVGILVLGVHYSAYTSEVYRSGIEAVPRGQWEAATALNLPRGVVWRRIVLPQAVPPIVPAMGNYLVGMFKDTPMLYALTVREMMSEANNFGSRTGSYMEVFTLVGVIFLVLSLGSAVLIRGFERRFVPREA